MQVRISLLPATRDVKSPYPALVRVGTSPGLAGEKIAEAEDLSG
ncbi:hypothetical protein [Umezakia ovalisporum]|uniref:Uncharacterized protein n=1 Tax=Umezakia ovalisporum FSS-43 TaxID=2740520 RepID=A0ABT6K3K4_9CYAN|nr:hypothetical protein [Umezakia ovalisporum]MDH6056565.1 hypothetical protein [Umezakia ovalisporum FSS-43]